MERRDALPLGHREGIGLPPNLASETAGHAELSDGPIRDLGSHIMPFASYGVIWNAPPKLRYEELIAVPPEDLARQAVEAMGDCALITQNALMSKVFRGVAMPKKYKDGFFVTLQTLPGVTELLPPRSNMRTAYAIAQTQEDEARLVDLRKVQESALNRLRLAKEPRDLPFVDVLRMAQTEAIRSGIAWDARAENIVAQFLQIDVRAANSRGGYIVRSQRYAASHRVNIPGSAWSQMVRRVELARRPYNRSEPHERVMEASPEEFRQTAWEFAPGIQKPSSNELQFTTVGEAIDYFVRHYNKQVSVQDFSNIMRTLAMRRDLAEETDRALREALLLDTRFHMLGHSALHDSIFRLEPPGASDTVGIKSLESLADMIVEAAQQHGVLEQMPQQQLLQTTLRLVDRELSQYRGFKLVKILEAHPHVELTSHPKGILYRIKPPRNRKITRAGQPVAAAEPLDLDKLNGLINDVVSHLDENMISVTKEHLVSRIRDIDPGLSKAAERALGGLFAQHVNLSPREDSPDSFNFIPTSQTVRSKQRAAAAKPRRVVAEFDGLGTIKRTNRKKTDLD